MIKILMAVVLAGMTGGAYAADFSDLQTVKVSDIKAIAAADAVPPTNELYIFKGESEQTVDTDALDANRKAHLTVWTTLLFTEQFFEVFCKSGKREIAMFPAWREGNTSTRAAEQLSYRMDAVFRVHGAKNNYPESRAILAKLLVAGREGGKNVRWLADGIDELYTFWKE